MTVARTYRGLTSEQRRTQRRAKLVEAAIDLLASDGVVGATGAAICKKAGLTERYFYENFADRDALFAAIIDEMLVHTQAAVLAAVHDADATIAARLRAAIRAFAEFIETNPKLARVAFVESVTHPVLRAAVRTSLDSFGALIVAVATEYYDLPAALPDKDARVPAVMLTGGLFATFATWIEGNLEVTTEDLVERCAAVFTAVANDMLSQLSGEQGAR